MKTLPDRADLLESVAPFLVLAALVLVSPQRRLRSFSSPLVWIAVATVGMSWPRWGLLHLSATTGLLALALARALRAGILGARRLARSRSRRRRVGSLAMGGGLLATHVVVAVAGGGAELLYQAGPGIRYWDEPEFRTCAAEARDRVGEARELFSYYATNDNVYVLARAFPPGGLYVNPGPVFFLEEDGLDARVIAALEERPGLPVLYREPSGSDHAWAARTQLWRFLAARTRVVSPSAGGGEWREVTPAPGRLPRQSLPSGRSR